MDFPNKSNTTTPTDLQFDLDEVLTLTSNNYCSIDEIDPTVNVTASTTLHNKEVILLGGDDHHHSEGCMVCMERMQPGDQGIQLKPCGHIYHTTCITTWLSFGNSCPLCRRLII